MKSLRKEKRYDLIDDFNSTSRYLDDLHVNGSGSITSVGEERANLSVVVYL